MEHDTRGLNIPQRIGEGLLKDNVISVEQLQIGLSEQQALGVPLGRVLVCSGYASERQIARCLARLARLPFVDLHSVDPPERQVVQLLPCPTAHDLGLLPLWDDDGAIVVASPDPPHLETLAEAARLLGRPVLPAVATRAEFEATLDEVHREQHVQIATSYLASGSPDDSAQRTLTRRQQVFLLTLLAALGLGTVVEAQVMGILLAAASTAFYLAFSIYKLYLVVRALTHKLEIETTDAELAALQDRDLPVYTLLVPLYREAEVLPTLIEAIQALDYPKVKLDVRLLLEHDDYETLAVARTANLPSHFTIVVIPTGRPKGKPKACNYGMIQARGDYVVIYDAEDLPEPDQLKRAVVAFRKGGDRLACVQAKLNFYNPRQNLLTRWFTTEYSMWFDLLLPGLDADGAAIPLGGTSNHFPMDCLREIGAWDPNNVTEDADLGVRLYKAGWKTAIIDSTTYEEANPDVYNWIRQRSRWVKGYVQTYLVHMRHPVELRQKLGTRAFLSFQLVVGGTFFALLMNPLFWVLTTLWFIAGSEWIQAIFPAPVLYLAALATFVGNFSFLYLNVAACLHRRHYDLVPFALLSPIYWSLMSLAAWKGFLQLFYAPSYWEKTRHGLHNARANWSVGRLQDGAEGALS
jgi:cellulose synthase/poly-beta-1,6-N-acetylglucosamine synthase-like glycosyltransferase